MGSVETLTEETITRLTEAFGAKLLLDPAQTERYSHDRSHHDWTAADVVVRCTSTEDVSRAMLICSESSTPVVPFGTGTGLEGGANSVRSGVCIDVSGMQRIIRFDPDSLDVTVEAGVKRSQLNPVLAPHGLHFPVGPGVDASIGGMAATGASGTNAVFYGTMRGSVLGLTVVLADGSVIHTGGRARKSSAGYDLTHLFIGSEGTLGIITEVTLKVYGIPPAAAMALCVFNDLVTAAKAVQRALTAGLPLARVELLDEVTVDSINSYSGLSLTPSPTLIVEFIGGKSAVSEQLGQMREIANQLGAEAFTMVDGGDNRERIWQARHSALPAAQAMLPGSRTWSTDVCVPISRLADCIGQTQADLRELAILAPIVGHVGDGNFHLAFVLNPDAPDDVARARVVDRRLIDRALAMGGTCTGEHGVGLGKVNDLLLEHPSGVPVMRVIKGALDPKNLLNPGKVLAQR
ncbi:MAG: FAD-binding protein [Microbacteriaceae bacterium]|nr:MAG: FAD-binding protein [Microbacteriaceae bacterium]